MKSILVYNDGRLICVFPANEKDTTIWSHQGLTYGGIIMSEEITTPKIIEVLIEINNFYRTQGYKKVIYKSIPWIYHKIPAEEDIYALFKETNAHLIGCNISSTIDMSNKPRFKELRRRGVKKAKKNGLIVLKSNDIDAYWEVLSETLDTEHGVKPIHNVEEIKMLIDRFPDRIKLYAAYCEQKLLGGSLVFETGQVLHTQYIAASEEGKHVGALDLVFDKLINEVYIDYKYFDFGISTEARGHYLNNSLIFQKEQFGGHGVVYNIYEYSL